MTPTNQLRIKVIIAGFTFFMRIDPKEEETIRKAIKHIDDKLSVLLILAQEFVKFDAQLFELLLKGTGVGARFLLLIQYSYVECYH